MIYLQKMIYHVRWTQPVGKNALNKTTTGQLQEHGMHVPLTAEWYKNVIGK